MATNAAAANSRWQWADPPNRILQLAVRAKDRTLEDQLAVRVHHERATENEARTRVNRRGGDVEEALVGARGLLHPTLIERAVLALGHAILGARREPDPAQADGHGLGERVKAARPV